MTQDEHDAKKAELLTLQSEIESQFRTFMTDLHEHFERVQEARLALYAEKNAALVEITNVIATKFGMHVDIETIEDEIRSATMN